MGCRGFEHNEIAPGFAFGHGLSYTTFQIGAATLSSGTFQAGDTLTVSVPVTNTGARAGSEVVQCYVSPPSARLARPVKELKAFAKVWLEPGETTTVDLVLEGRAFAYWEPGQDDWDDVQTLLPAMFNLLSPPAPRRERGWQVDAGRYDLLIGRSSDDAPVRCSVAVPDATSWR